MTKHLIKDAHHVCVWLKDGPGYVRITKRECSRILDDMNAGTGAKVCSYRVTPEGTLWLYFDDSGFHEPNDKTWGRIAAKGQQHLLAL